MLNGRERCLIGADSEILTGDREILECWSEVLDEEVEVEFDSLIGMSVCLWTTSVDQRTRIFCILPGKHNQSKAIGCFVALTSDQKTHLQ